MSRELVGRYVVDGGGLRVLAACRVVVVAAAAQRVQVGSRVVWRECVRVVEGRQIFSALAFFVWVVEAAGSHCCRIPHKPNDNENEKEAEHVAEHDKYEPNVGVFLFKRGGGRRRWE